MEIFFYNADKFLAAKAQLNACTWAWSVHLSVCPSYIILLSSS